MDTTDNLALPYIMPSQAQKHVTHNEALRMLDALVQPAVEGIATEPPGDPQAGMRVIVGEGATGAFAGREGRVAQWSDGGWMFHAPRAGWMVYDLSAEAIAVFDGGGWTAFVSGGGEGGGLPAEVELLGIAATADEENRLAVASDAVLLSHAGSDHRLKINKASGTDTASLVFQSAFSGRAEMGLAGDDDFAVKVSADGTDWAQAMVVDAASGRVRFPGGGVREQLAAPRTYHVAPGGSDAADGLTTGTAFATLQRAVDAALAIDPFGQPVTIQLAAGTYSAGAQMSRPLFDGGTLTIRGDVTTPDNVALAVPGGNVFVFDGSGVKVRLEGLRLSGAVGLWARYGAVVLVREKLTFGACSARHVGADNGAYVEIVAQVAIAGSAPHHLYGMQNGHILMTGSTVTLTGTPAFSAAFARSDLTGMISCYGNSFTGPATGPRYAAATNGVIFVNGGGANALPGSSSGSVSTGGQYG